MKINAKNTLLSVLTLSLLFAYSTTFAQDDEDGVPFILAELSFMKPLNDTYVDVEKKIWKPIHQERINRGDLTAWYLFRVRYPVGTETKYNYVTVNIYNDPSKQLKEPFANFEEIFKKVHPDMKAEDMEKKTSESRDLKWSGLWVLLDDAIPGPPEKPSEYMQVNFFTAAEGDFLAYEEMESEVFKPVHKAMAEAGARKDWTLWRKFSPTGTDHGTTHITIDSWGTWEDMTADNGVDMDEIWKKVHPDMDQGEAWQKMSQLRSTTRSETWVLVDYVKTKSE